MKRKFNYLIALALMAFTFTSCEDVPSPFGEVVPPKGDDVVVIDPSGTGTEADPFNIAGVIEYVSGLGADVVSPKDVYFKGIITSVTEAYGTQYGNATFEVSDTEDGGNKFLCYRVKYFNNQGYSNTSDPNIKEGNEVIMCGKVVNYKGNTPETSANAAWLYSLNGTKGGGSTPATETLGTKDAPLTVAKALEYINKLEDNGTTKEDAYVTGKITKIKTAEADISKYKNIDYIISDGTNELTVFRGKNIDNTDFTEAGQINVGDEVVVFGKLTKFVKDGNVTPEVAQGNYIVKLTKGGSTPSGGDAKGTGTASDPFNIAAAIAKCKEVGETASTEKYYIKGVVVTGGTVSGGYGNVTFKMGDSKDATDLFTAYQVAGSDGEKLADGYEVKAGSTVIIYGPIVNYKGNTPETSGKSAAQIVTIDGKKTNEGGGGATGGDGSQNNPFNIAEAIAKCKEVGETASTVKYYIKGIVVTGGTVSGGYGNVTFKMGDSKDATELFTAYQVAGSDGEKLADGYEVKAGSTVIVYGPIVNYKGNTPETSGKSAAQIVTIDGKKTNEGSGGGGGGTGSSEVTASFGDLDCSNLASIKLSDGTTLAVAQEDGKSAPIYHESTKIIRIYARNSITINAGSKKIAKVIFAYDTYNGTAYKGNDEMYGEGSSKITPSKDDTHVTFSGVNSSTLKVVNWLESGNSGGTQFRISSITIQYQ